MTLQELKCTFLSKHIWTGWVQEAFASPYELRFCKDCGMVVGRIIHRPTPELRKAWNDDFTKTVLLEDK